MLLVLIRIPDGVHKKICCGFSSEVILMSTHSIMFVWRKMENDCFIIIKWASLWDYGSYHIGDQRRLRRACTSAQSRQSLRCSHTWSMELDEELDQKSDIYPHWMCIWRMILQRTKSTIISWDGSNVHIRRTKSTIISWNGSNVHSWLFSYVALCCLFITNSISSITRPYWSKAEVLPLHCKYLIVVEIRIIVAFSNLLPQKHDTILHQFTLSCLSVQFDQFKQLLTYYQSCFKCNISFLALLWDGLKILWDLKILWELASRWAKFCDILSHNVRYGVYAVDADDWCNKVWVHPNFTQYGSQF